jgi:hypothetical protein
MYKEFKQQIIGYYRDKNKNGIPEISGIYFVYTGTYHKYNDNVNLDQLIYIGESGDINNRIMNQEKYSEWSSYLKNDQELIFSYTEVDGTYRERLEAAYIYKHQPVVNTECKESFNYDKTRVISSGVTEFLDKDFTLERS